MEVSTVPGRTAHRSPGEFATLLGPKWTWGLPNSPPLMLYCDNDGDGEQDDDGDENGEVHALCRQGGMTWKHQPRDDGSIVCPESTRSSPRGCRRRALDQRHKGSKTWSGMLKGYCLQSVGAHSKIGGTPTIATTYTPIPKKNKQTDK